MESVKYSIIVPVYNAEQFLERCIKSLIGQTYKNIEVIFINDGSSDTSGDILKLIMFKNKTKLKNSLNFAADSLFCEWAYVIDLDKNTYEVYKGFNKEPLDESERFYFLTPIAEKEYRENPKEYYPVKFVTEYSFDSLPDEKDFLEDISEIYGFDEEE